MTKEHELKDVKLCFDVHDAVGPSFWHNYKGLKFVTYGISIIRCRWFGIL